MAVTLLNGSVKLIKMPPVLNPLENEKPAEGQPGSRDSNPSKPVTGGAGARNVPERSSADMGSMNSLVQSEQEATVMLKNDIDKFPFEELQLDAVCINTIAAKKKSEFVDPFNPEEEKKEDGEVPPAEPSKPVS